MKKFGISALLLTTLALPLAASADIKITEIMYDLSGTDTDREWVEIYNDGTDPVNIVTGSSKGSWRFVDNSSHTLTPFVEGDTQIAPGEYAIIAKDGAAFMTDWPNFTGTIFTSPLSLPNTSATLSIKDGDAKVLDTVSYDSGQGANGDGNSLQKNSSGKWAASSPTPGQANSESSSSSGEVLGASTSSSSSSSQSTGSTVSTQSTNQGVLDVLAGPDRSTSPGSPITFQATVKKNTVQNAGLTFSWSFGDGNVGEGQTPTHTYEYAGEYVAVLTARAGNVFSVSRIKVHVNDASLSIKANDTYIEITNQSSSEINLFNWKIVRHNKGFVFQPDTIILPKSTLRIAASLLKMKGEAESNTALKDYLGNVVATFEDPISKEEISNLQNSLAEAETKVLAMRSSFQSKNVARTEETTKNQNLAAVVAAQENIENAVDPKEEIQGEKFEREVVKTKWQTFFEYLRNIFR